MLKLTLIAFICLYSTVFCDDCPTIISRDEWGTPANSLSSNLKNVKYVIIHHTDTRTCEAEDCYALLKSIYNYHTKTRRWADIGYNFLVDSAGNIFEGRGFGVIGAHAPKYNARSVGIAVFGDYMVNEPNSEIKTAIQDLIQCGINEGYVSEDYKLIGHSQVRATACPGTNLFAEISNWPHFAEQP